MDRSTIQAPLCDGLARGRLSLAEICGLEPEELDALCELGAERLELGWTDEALRIFAGLIALYPFEARYWRCYAVALHRAGREQTALQACQAALTLDASSKPAQTHLKALDEAVASRPEDESLEPRDEPTGLSMQDGRPLPLSPSTFPLPPEPETDTHEVLEPTVVSPPPLPSNEVTEIMEAPAREVTKTAIIKRRPTKPSDGPTRMEGTQTAIIRRRRGHRLVEATSDEVLDNFFESGEDPSDA